MKIFECSLCKSGKYVEISRHDSADTVAAYKNRFGVDVGRFFPDAHFSTLQCVNCGLRTHHPSMPGDSRFYDEMQRHPFYYEPDKPEFSYALSKIIQFQPRTILEIGCGEGLFLKRLMNAYDVAAIEHSEKAIEKLTQAGISQDTPGRKYDFVMFFQVLEHVEDVRQFLDLALSKLNDRGLMLITVPNNDSKYMQEGTSAVLEYPPHHLTQWPRKALEKIADLHGLRIQEYYEEPMRIEHLVGLLSARRNRLPGSGLLIRVINKLGRIFDRILAPYYLDHVGHGGHTHGILFQKKG